MLANLSFPKWQLGYSIVFTPTLWWKCMRVSLHYSLPFLYVVSVSCFWISIIIVMTIIDLLLVRNIVEYYILMKWIVYKSFSFIYNRIWDSYTGVSGVGLMLCVRKKLIFWQISFFVFAFCMVLGLNFFGFFFVFFASMFRVIGDWVART